MNKQFLTLDKHPLRHVLIKSLPKKLETIKKEFYDSVETEEKFLARFKTYFKRKQNTDITNLTLYDKILLYKVDHPDYVFWTPLKLIRNGNEEEVKVYDSYSISTNGEIYSHLNQLIMKVKTKKTGYKELCIKILTRSVFISHHRAMMSSFGFDIKHQHKLNTLTINHKNGIKIYNDLSNLEWMTTGDNSRDRSIVMGKLGKRYGTRPIKITALEGIEGVEQGTVFYLRLSTDGYKYGLTPGITNKPLNGTGSCYNCKLEYIDCEELPEVVQELPLELLSHFEKKRAMFNGTLKLKLFLTKELCGYKAGTIFVTTKEKILSMGVGHGSVASAISGSKTLFGFKFSYLNIDTTVDWLVLPDCFKEHFAKENKRMDLIKKKWALSCTVVKEINGYEIGETFIETDLKKLLSLGVRPSVIYGSSKRGQCSNGLRFNRLYYPGEIENNSTIPSDLLKLIS